MSGSFDAAAFQRATDVSRETLAKLEAYAELLRKWQRRINLVSAATLADLWQRHMLDSAQLAPLIRAAGLDAPSGLDMGTGAGFPGMVLAIMGAGRWTLVDSDQRKGVFLQEVARVTGIPVVLRTARLEALEDTKVDVVSARGCAPLTSLLGYAAPLMHAGSRAFLMKGRDVDAEIAAARLDWSFTCEVHRSVTDTSARILEIRDIERV